MFIFPEATIFWTVILGLSVIVTLILFKVLITWSITSLTCAIDFVPVQTRFPDEKTSTADFGCFILKTSPGNCSGLYSVFGIVFASLVRGISFPKEVVATIFWIFRDILWGFAILYYGLQRYSLSWKVYTFQ